MNCVSLDDLPEVIVEYILSHVSPYTDFNNCKLVNKAWNAHIKAVAARLKRDFDRAIIDHRLVLRTDAGSPTGSMASIAERHSHAAAILDSSMYVFGGCTTNNTTFNDLWRFDLSERRWVRPLAIGTYPPPKAYASLVAYDNRLYLFGGWTHNSPNPLHTSWKFFRHLHMYSVTKNCWTSLNTLGGCPASAGHSASLLFGNKMVVFGGLQNLMEGYRPILISDAVWVLDLASTIWFKPETSRVKPTPRYGHSAIVVDDRHLLIIGGYSGPNALLNDIWLLEAFLDPEVPWQWHSITLLPPENGAEAPKPQLSFHPACKVGDKVVILSRSPKMTVSNPKPNTLLLPTRPTRCRTWVPPRAEEGPSLQQQPQAGPSRPLTGGGGSSADTLRETCVNGKQGVLKRSSPNDSSSPFIPPQDPTTRPPPRKDRLKQLQQLDRAERQLRERQHLQQLQKQRKPVRVPMSLCVMDISEVTTKHTIRWLPASEQSLAIEEVMLYTLLLGKGELIMFGGIQRDASRDIQPVGWGSSGASNSLYIITAQREVI